MSVVSKSGDLGTAVVIYFEFEHFWNQTEKI